MELLVDTHTHTVASGHAYSTVRENAILAKELGMEAICCTDHGPALRNGAVDFIVTVLPAAPDVMEGIRVFNGAETNIVDFEGNIDIIDKWMRHTDFGIASMHDIVIDPGTKEQNTNAMLGALQNKYIDVIGHPGNPHYDIDRETLVKETKKLNKLIELNNHSFIYRKGSKPNCKDFLTLCKKHDVRITVSSDAHICYRVGAFDMVREALKEAGFPQELIVSRSLAVFNGYIEERKNRLNG